MVMNPTLSIWNWTVSWHAIGLVIMLAVAYLALRVPRRMQNQRLARAGQLAAGLYVTLVGLIGLALAAICATRSPGWFDADGLCNPATLVLLGGVLLLGVSLTLIATQHLVRGDVNFLYALGWPAWLSGILATISLCALWFGTGGTHGSPDRQGAIAVALTTGVVAVLALIGWLVVVARSPKVRAELVRAAIVAAIAATQQGILLLVHATAHGRIHAGGVDIIISASILTTAAFLAGMLVEDTAAHAAEREPLAHAA